MDEHSSNTSPLLPLRASCEEDSICGPITFKSIFNLKNFFVLLGPLLCSLICVFVKFDGPSPTTSRNMLGVLAWVFAWWMTEAVPMPITSMSPLFLFPLFGIAAADDVAHTYMDDVIALVLGSFILALAVEHYNIHRRLALNKILRTTIHLTLNLMASQQDIYAAGAENRPPMLEKGGYLPWTSRMLRYIKTKDDGKLMIKSIENGPFKPRQVLIPGNPDTTPPTQPFYRDQTEDDYTPEDWKQIKADDMAMNLIQLGLPHEIFAAVDSCDTAYAMWERVRRLCHGTEIGQQDVENKLLTEWENFTSTAGEQIESYYTRFCTLMNELIRNKLEPRQIMTNIKFISNLPEEWSRYVTIVNQTKNLHQVNYDQLYDFLKQNQAEANEVRKEKLAKNHDPLALIATTPTHLPVNTTSSSSTHNYMQQPYIPQLPPVYQQSFYPQHQHEVIPQQQPYQQFQEHEVTDHDESMAAITQAFALLSKAFQGRYSTPTNNNQRISSNTRYRQVAQPSFNMGNQGQLVGVMGNQQGYAQGYQMGNQLGQYAGNQMGQNTRNQMGQFVGNQRGKNIGNQAMGNQVGNVAAPVGGNYGNGNQGNLVKCFNCQGVGHMARNCPSKPNKKDPEYLQKALMLAQKEKAGFQLNAEENDYMALMDDMEDQEDIDANCIFMANLQEAKYDTDSEAPPVYDTNAISED